MNALGSAAGLCGSPGRGGGGNTSRLILVYNPTIGDHLICLGDVPRHHRLCGEDYWTKLSQTTTDTLILSVLYSIIEKLSKSARQDNL
ncbi:hypothetical protein J6590_013397 [Homalodisca vitripennis]|nr:hypothetical protein J6590_013397 [Homalodisca vitripennis]